MLGMDSSSQVFLCFHILGLIFFRGVETAPTNQKTLATMQAYAVKLAVIFVPLPPPLGVIIEKGAPLGSYTALRLNMFITRWSPSEDKDNRLD